jgi:hypothetical protein
MSADEVAAVVDVYIADFLVEAEALYCHYRLKY